MSDIVEFRHLEYLVEIAARKNFSRAAEHVYRSQPALSHQIKNLEADIGFPLLVRNGRKGVYPTPAGELVLGWAKIVLAERRDIFIMAKAIHDRAVPPLRLGFSSFVNGFLLENFRNAYEGLFPQCEILLSSGDTKHMLERLEIGTLDCALLLMPINKELWKVRQIAQAPLAVCMRSDDPLSAQSQLRIEDVAPRLTIFRDPELHPAAHTRLVEMFAEAGVTLQVASSAATPTDMQFMVKQRFGLALIDQLSPLDAGLVTRPLSGLSWTADTAFVTGKSKHLALLFVDRLFDDYELQVTRKAPETATARRPQQMKLIG